MCRSFALFALVAIAALAPAQVVGPADRGTITAEATESVRLKPDLAKLYLKVETKNPDATAAYDESIEQVKQFTDAIEKMKLKGIKTLAQAQRTQRVEIDNRNVAPGNVGPRTTIEYRVTRSISLTVTDANFDSLSASIEKIQLEASKAGVSGEYAISTYNYTVYGNERSNPIRVVFAKKDGWDDLLTPAIEKATARAKSKAEAMARGAGLKPGDVFSITEITNPSYVQSYNPNINNQSPTEGEDEFADGEILRKVRVRVSISSSK